jgi:hypothetical protein
MGGGAGRNRKRERIFVPLERKAVQKKTVVVHVIDNAFGAAEPAERA